MAVQYEWRFGPMKVETVNEIPNVVTSINWMCIAQDLARSPNAAGTTSGTVATPLPDSNNFVPLEDLTTSIIEGWITQNIQKSEIESQCAASLEQELTPPVQWVNVSQPISEEITANLSTPGFVPFSPDLNS